MAVLSISSVNTSFILCPTLLYSPLKLCVFVGDSSGQPNCDRFLPQNWHNRSVLFAVKLFGCKIDFAHLHRWLLRPARDRHTFPHMSLLAW